jgi:hypothetical protein
MKGIKGKTISKHKFGVALSVGQLNELAIELYGLRISPPDVQLGKGSRVGEILRFVRGLRFSARVIYFLRDQLSNTNLDVSWGHLLDHDQASCSPECDIIIHEKGYVKKWNGNDHPIMDFRFITVEKAKAVVSCKSLITTIDPQYPKELKSYGVKNILLLAECCKSEQFDKIKEAAKKAGYTGFWCLYFIKQDGVGFEIREALYTDFVETVFRTVGN